MVRNWQKLNIAIATNELEDQFEILQAKLDITCTSSGCCFMVIKTTMALHPKIIEENFNLRLSLVSMS
jgi:hypothetical protein